MSTFVPQLALDPVELVPDNNYDIIAFLEKRDTVSTTPPLLKWIADSGILNATALVSLTSDETAVAIAPAVDTLALTEIGTSGYYFGVLLGSAITSALAAYKDTETPIYVIVKSGATLRVVVECRIVSARRAPRAA